ncbi:hypothetical protein QVD17_30585 [Tagetes erecta]|uniref:Uncharacterized protein n=1 Tax=Tagetes erecta TaxID=13708 RepID=A0AAD8NND1_TARER|nr:hypothetical protein QVD17_30585 [Tagetes erecta]
MTEMNTTPTPDLTLPATLNSDSETCGDGDDNGKGDICFKGDRSSSSSSSSFGDGGMSFSGARFRCRS